MPADNVLARIALQFPNGYANAADLRSAVTSANCGTVAVPVACSSNTGFAGKCRQQLAIRCVSVDANLKIPESYQFNIGFEREIGERLGI